MLTRKAIWFIIGLMATALLGIIWLQIMWINWSIDLNQENLSREIYSSINKVAQKLQAIERKKSQDHVFDFLKRDEAIVSTRLTEEGEVLSIEYRINSDGEFDFDIEDTTLIGDVAFQSDSYQQQAALFEASRLLDGIEPLPLAERIDLDHLNYFLKQEFENRGINSEYEYGVYSVPKEAFVIKNNHYLFENTDRNNDYQENLSLFKSKYRVQLFPSDDKMNGYLMVDFPNERQFLWSSVWQALIASIIFTGIILICFVYTFNIIFRQKQLSEMKTDFINNMTHEFKTPIATISLAVDSMTSPMILKDREKVSRFANIIKEENKRMNSQVEKVLQMALIDKSDFSLNIVELNLHELIEQAVQFASLLVSRKGGAINTDLLSTHPILMGDKTHIVNVIHNLLDNANKYSPGKPEITIRTRDRTGGVEVTVEDKGIGMNADAKKQIFDKFYRVHTGDLHDVKGFGLGLSYVKAIVTAHKGQISVKSELGKGSQFIIFFPYQVEK